MYRSVQVQIIQVARTSSAKKVFSRTGPDEKPDIGRPLVAKLGHGRRIRHFAHLAEDTVIDCSAEKANESGLHKMAKNLICESTYLNLPEVEILAQNDPDRNMDDYNQQKSLICGRKFKLQYHKVQTEVLFHLT